MATSPQREWRGLGGSCLRKGLEMLVMIDPMEWSGVEWSEERERSVE